ncbi:MAG: geranylgeranyl diphosphate reductase [Deltaproteobacteria bacterium]|nr:geranylgeranyl diphosphate reductase [Deltaproteobacteria bacterium]
MERYDCVIVGAGPGGSIFARNAAQKGLRTLIVEKESLPRYKTCGGGLTPAVKNLLDFDYSPLIERKVSGVAFLSRDECERVYYPDSMPVEMVARSDFDHFLVRQATSAGATLIEKTKVVSIRESRDDVIVETGNGDKMSALIVVGADGARSVVARAAGFNRGYGGIAIEAEIFPRDPGIVDEHGKHSIFGFGFIPGDGYGWVFPKKDHFSVGIGTSNARMPGLVSIYREFIERFDFLKAADEEQIRGWFIPYCKSSETINTRRICLVGDSAHLVDPFSGEGIYHAILSGIIGADIVSDELGKKGYLSRRYSKEIKKQITGDFMFGRWCSEIYYRAPSYFYRKNRVIQALTRLAKKEIRYKNVLNELRKSRKA